MSKKEYEEWSRAQARDDVYMGRLPMDTINEVCLEEYSRYSQEREETDRSQFNNCWYSDQEG